VVLTIFVNPTQFGPSEDFDAYPRDEPRDLELAKACGVDVVFAPTSAAELYAPGGATWVEVAELDRYLCGASRPGHFRGVCTVVAKLWGLLRPARGYFGEKDFQQLAILRRMHRDLFLPGEIVGMPIVREPDGLALSSRNVRLTPEARAAALAIPRFLRAVEQRFAAGERAVDALLAEATTSFPGGTLDYASIVDAETLQPVLRVAAPARLAVAAHFGGVRLIDNLALMP
jgi:pantoate--beta-alanine ligase